MTTRGEINSNFYQIVYTDANGAPTQVKPEYLPEVGNAVHANFADVANSVSVSNVVGIGNIATTNLNGVYTDVLHGNGAWAPVPGSVPGGSNTQIQFNDNNTFNGNSGLTFNKTTTTLTSNNFVATSTANLGSVANITITGGSAGKFLQTDGTGVLSWQSVIAGDANYANYAGNVTVSSQPNITSVGSLINLNVIGNITSGNANLGNIVVANYFVGDGSSLTNIAGASVVGDVSGANHANVSDVANSVSGSNVSGQVANALVAGTVYTNAQPNITSTGTLVSLNVSGNITTGNASLGNLASANYISGNANLVTGLTLAGTNFNDVSITTPTNQQVLQYNGSLWVNNTLNIPSSAGSGVSFWFTSPIIVPAGPNNFSQIDTLNDVPNTSPIQYSSATINNATEPVMGVLTLPLGRTQFDPGNWDLSIWANANSSGGTTSISPCVYQVNPQTSTNTVTITGTGTSRTATATGGNPFVNSVGSASATAASYLQTPNGIFQITSKTNSNVVTIKTLTTYVNESSVSFFVWDLFYSLPAKNITATLAEYLFSTTTNSLVVNTTTRLGIIVVGITTQNRTIYVSYNDTNQSSHILTPFITLHDNLAGLQGGQSGEYFHLTNSEYTGTGTGVFVRQSSPSLTTPNIGVATGTSLDVTGNAVAGAVKTDSLLHANGVAWSFGGNPGGNTTELQFNNAGTFGGIANVTYSAGNLSLGNIANVKMTGGTSNFFARTDGLGNLSWQAITSNLTVGTRTVAVNIAITNYQMNVAARTGNVVVNVN